VIATKEIEDPLKPCLLQLLLYVRCFAFADPMPILLSVLDSTCGLESGLFRALLLTAFIHLPAARAAKTYWTPDSGKSMVNHTMGMGRSH